MKKQFVLQSCFFYALPRHNNIMKNKRFKFFDECATRCVHNWQHSKFTEDAN